MFKRPCRKCGEKIKRSFNFCPNCGHVLKERNGDEWGMLGKNDIREEDFMNSFFEGFGGKMLNSMLGNAMKMFEKGMKNVNQAPKSNFRLMINGKEVNFENPQRIVEKEPNKIQKNIFTKEQLKKFSELSKEEPKTNLKRLGDKIIYEIEMPEIKSIKDILINRLENSIEIKAISEKKAYWKIIPINTQIINKNLLNGKLVLELKGN